MAFAHPPMTCWASTSVIAQHPFMARGEQNVHIVPFKGFQTLPFRDSSYEPTDFNVQFQWFCVVTNFDGTFKLLKRLEKLIFIIVH